MIQSVVFILINNRQLQVQIIIIMTQQQLKKKKEQDQYFYKRLKDAFEQQKDIQKFKIIHPYGQAQGDFNFFVEYHIKPYVMARKAINNLSENLRQRKNRSKDTLSKLYSFSKSVTNNDQVQYNMEYFLQKEEQVVVAKKKLEGLKPKQNELDIKLSLADLVETIVKRVNVYAAFIKYNGEVIRNQRGSTSNESKQLYLKLKDKDDPLHEQMKLIESFGIEKISTQGNQNQMIIRRSQFDKIMFAFKTKCHLHDNDPGEILKIIKDDLLYKQKEESELLNWIRQIKSKVENKKQLPSQYEWTLSNLSTLQKAFFDLLSTIRKVFSQHYSRTYRDRQIVYYPKDGVQYDRIVKIIQDLYQKMTKNAYQNKIEFDKQVEQVEKQIKNHRIQNHKNVATLTSCFNSLIESKSGRITQQQSGRITQQQYQPEIDVQQLLLQYNLLLEKRSYYDSLEEELIQLIQTFRATKPTRSQTVIDQQRGVDMKILIEIKKYIQLQASGQDGNTKIEKRFDYFSRTSSISSSLSHNHNPNISEVSYKILFHENQTLKSEKGKLTSQLIETKQQLDSILKNNDQTSKKKEVDTLSSKLEVKKIELEEAKRQNISLKAQNQANLKQKERLIKQLQQSQKKYTHFKGTSSEQYNQIQSLRGQLNTNSNTSDITKQWQQKVVNLQTICQEKKGLINQHQSTIQQLNQQINTLNSTITDMERQERAKITRQQIKYDQMSHLFDEKGKILQEKDQELRNVQSSLDQLKREKLLQQSKMENVQQEKKKIQQQLTLKDLQFETFSNQKIGQIQSKQATIQTQQTQISQFEKQITQLKGQLERYKGIDQQKNQQILSINLKMTKQINSIQAAKKQISDELEKAKAEIKKKEEQINTKQKEINQLKETTNNNTTIINQLKKQIPKLQDQNKKTNDKLSKMSSRFTASTICSDTNVIPYSRILFNQDIFLQDDKSKQILISHIEKYAKGATIKRTPLIYKYDPRNKNNFHLYIDDIKNLTLVVKTKHAIIAGFYPGEHKEKELMNKGGLLVSVTNDQSYTLFEKKPGMANSANIRGMTYDQFFAIYGNAQIRIKTGLKTVFSNFGVNNAFYNSRGHKIDVFLNEGDKRQVEFDYMEFYQVIFEEEPIEYQKEIV